MYTTLSWCCRVSTCSAALPTWEIMNRCSVEHQRPARNTGSPRHGFSPEKGHLVLMASNSAAEVVEYDLLPRISPFLDKHLLFPLLEHTQKQSIYAEDQVLRAQLHLLTKTKLVDFAMDKYKLLHKTEEIPEGNDSRTTDDR